MQSDTISLVIICLCLLLSAYFSATETAFSSMSRVKMKTLADKGDGRAALVLRLSQSYDALLSTILIGNNIVNIASASLATVIFVRLLGEERGPGISTLVTTVVVLIFGEISPKSIAKESPERFAMLSAPLLRVFLFCLTPVNFLFKQWKKLLSLVFKTVPDGGLTGEELLTIVEEAQQGGGLDDQESALIRSAIGFSDLEARAVMTPRPDVAAVAAGTPPEEIARLFSATGFSRLPVYRSSLDEIVGLICQKDFHNQVLRTGAPLESILRPVLFCTEGQKIGPLLARLQQSKLHLAVVVDEFGGTEGIVTLEDILEELVGDIWDEHDEVVQDVEELSPTRYCVRGCANAEALFRRLGCACRTEAVTVSGWVLEQLGRLPQPGEQFSCGGIAVTVLEVSGRRIVKLQLELPAAEKPPSFSAAP